MRTLCWLSFGLIALGRTAAAQAPERLRYEPAGHAVRVLAPGAPPTEVAAPGVVLAVLAANDRLYAACGDAGLVEYTLAAPGSPTAPVLRAVRDVGGSAVGLHVADGRVWIEIARVEARPLDSSPSREAAIVPTVQAPPASATSALEEAPAGRVVGVGVGAAVVDLGARDGVAKGDHVALLRRIEQSLGDGESGLGEEVLAVGVVTTVSAGRAEVELGLGERVPVGAIARVTRDLPSASTEAPPRLGGLYDVGFTMRPFLALGSFGFGTVSDATIGYRFEAPARLQLLFEPAGFGLADEGNIVALAGTVLGSYETSAFEIGMGLGWSAVNAEIEGAGESRAASAGAEGLSTDIDNVRSGLGIGQVARLGPPDGVHLAVRNTFLLYRDAFRYGGTVARGQIRLARKVWAVVGGGGGRAGFAYAEIGTRVLARGNGDHGSLFVTATVGGAGVFGERDDEGETKKIGYGGPMLGLGLEWRP